MAGAIRMLQPKEYGGAEAHPREFAETVMRWLRSTRRQVGCTASSAWTLTVGVRRPQGPGRGVGGDQDTWMASPYMPGRLCIPVDDGNALRMDKPPQRFWRDAHAGQHHAIHVPGTVFHASTLSRLGVDPQGPLRAMI